MPTTASPCPSCAHPIKLDPQVPPPAPGDLSMCDRCLEFVVMSDTGWADPTDEQLEVVTPEQEDVLQAFRARILEVIPDRWLVVVRESETVDEDGNNTYVQIVGPIPAEGVESSLQNIFGGTRADYIAVWVAVWAMEPEIETLREVLQGGGDADDLLDFGHAVAIFELEIEPVTTGPVAEA